MLDVGQSYDTVERDTRKEEVCLHYFYIEKKTPEELIKDDPNCRDILVPGVPHTYLQQIADLDLAASWKKLDIPVLVIYGSSDPATSRDESHYLVDMINSFHPGKASYIEIRGDGASSQPICLSWAVLTRSRRPPSTIAPGSASPNRKLAHGAGVRRISTPCHAGACGSMCCA